MIEEVVVSKFNNSDDYVHVSYIVRSDLGSDAVGDLVTVRQLPSHLLKLLNLKVLDVAEKVNI